MVTQNSEKASKETFYLIDGYAAIFRAYYAIRHPLFSPVTGEPTQGVLVFAQMLLKLYTKLKPDYVAAALDAPGGTFRDELHRQYAEPDAEAEPVSVAPPVLAPAEPPAAAPPVRRVEAGYKGTRRSSPDPLGQQIPRVLQLLELFGIPTIARPGLEADDVIATLTDRVVDDPTHSAVHLRIVSRDKDLEQLLRDRVTLYDIHEETERDVAGLWEKRGVTPEQVVDLLSLTGDTVDNIPGVPGIGPRTAAKLLQRFGSVEAILANLDSLSGTWRNNLQEAAARLPLSRRLLTLHRDPEIPFTLESARARPIPVAELLSLFDELGFSKLKEQVERLQQ